MLPVFAQIATINIQVGFDLHAPLVGFLSEVYNPVSSESMYNHEGSEYDYSETPDFTETLIYANYMDLTRVDSSIFMDSYSSEPLAYTRNTEIDEKAKLVVNYQGKQFQFTVEETGVIELDDTVHGEAIRRLLLEPYS